MDVISSDNIIGKLSEIQQNALNIAMANLDDKVFNNININSELIDSGIDSITYIKIIVSLEVAFDIEFEDEMLMINTFPTIKTMLEYVESKILLQD